MALIDYKWDKLLRIKTTGWDASNSDKNHYPYEPTSYSVLERLAFSGYINKKNVLLDYGCGKGRVDFFMSYQTRCKTIGVEYDERLFVDAIDNSKYAISGKKTSFCYENAEDYEVPTTVDRCYFFNPFSVEILKKVISKVMKSYYDRPREILMFFYYPSDEYVAHLMTESELEFLDEIDCTDLFDSFNERERIVIFKVAL
ncbi:MAG: SAM-dependent methyltransferase [Lachnospiraceae bacterium]|nr:SAM-dependent methyltransferase [Lachnospiraceae bacterium]